MSKLSEVLGEYRVALDAAHERRAQSHDILDLVEQMIRDCVRALLEDLGNRSDPETTVDEMITKASAGVADHKERFSKDAPLQFFAREVEGFKQVLLDIGYLRKGFGLGSGRPQPEDMKWSRPGAVVSHVVSTMSYIAEELKSDDAQVHRLSPEVDLDLAAARDGIVELLNQDLDAVAFMHAAIDMGHSNAPTPGWDAYRDIPYEEEFDQRSSFFLEVVEREPPANTLTGFGVEIAYSSREGETTADLWLMGGYAYQPNDETWLDVQDYSPRDHAAHSEVLAVIYRLAYSPGGLGNAADYTLCLAWGTYFSRACAHRYLEETGLDRIGLRVGFGGGDWIDLGWVRPPWRLYTRGQP